MCSMRGIKVGNILVFRNCAVCIVSNIIKEEQGHVIVGTDSNNKEFRGPFTDWESIIHYKEKLLVFEDKIFNNIIAHREVEAR